MTAGGLTVRAFGANRPIEALDVYVPESDLPRGLDAVHEFRVWGPEHQRDDSRDLTFAKIERDGVKVELGRPEGARDYDRLQESWMTQAIDFSRSKRKAPRAPPSGGVTKRATCRSFRHYFATHLLEGG